MSQRDRLYAELLHRGLMILRTAHTQQLTRWVAAEIEFLHNVPSLIGECNIRRHVYFWEQECTHYIEIISSLGLDEASYRVRIFHVPVLCQLALGYSDDFPSFDAWHLRHELTAGAAAKFLESHSGVPPKPPSSISTP